MTDPEKAALHAYRARVQAEAVALGRQLNELAASAAEEIDRNNPALPYYAGLHAGYLAARGMCDRLLLVAEEAAGKAAAPSPDPEPSDGRAD
jgi:hypothetical protein